MASGAGVLILVGREVMHNFYALFLCNLMNSLTCNFPALHFVELSSFNLFLLHIFLPTSLAEDNEFTLARYISLPLPIYVILMQAKATSY